MQYGKKQINTITNKKQIIARLEKECWREISWILWTGSDKNDGTA